MTGEGYGAVLRWVRAALVAAVAFLSGAAAHVSAGGLMPGPVGSLVLVAALTAGCATLLGRPAGTARVVALVVAGQSLIHVSLSAIAGHRGDPARPAVSPALVPPSGDRTGSYFDQMAQPAHTDLVMPTWVSHLATELSGPGAWMAAAHLVAAAALGLWLASGERALWHLLTVLLASLSHGPALLAAATVPPVWVHQPFSATESIHASARAMRCTPLRGPSAPLSAP